VIAVCSFYNSPRLTWVCGGGIKGAIRVSRIITGFVTLTTNARVEISEREKEKKLLEDTTDRGL